MIGACRYCERRERLPEAVRVSGRGLRRAGAATSEGRAVAPG